MIQAAISILCVVLIHLSEAGVINVGQLKNGGKCNSTSITNCVKLIDGDQVTLQSRIKLPKLSDAAASSITFTFSRRYVITSMVIVNSPARNNRVKGVTLRYDSGYEERIPLFSCEQKNQERNYISINPSIATSSVMVKWTEGCNLNYYKYIYEVEFFTNFCEQQEMKNADIYILSQYTGSEAKVFCHSGYGFPDGSTSQTIICEENGQWNKSAPCNPLPRKILLSNDGEESGDILSPEPVTFSKTPLSYSGQKNTEIVHPLSILTKKTLVRSTSNSKMMTNLPTTFAKTLLTSTIIPKVGKLSKASPASSSTGVVLFFSCFTLIWNLF